MTLPDIGRIGIWSADLRQGDPGEAAEAAAELEALGYRGIWFPGGVGGDVTGNFARLLAATRTATIASGILNVWKHQPAEIAGWWHALPGDQQARALLGLGVSHGPLIGEAWGKPLAVTRDYVAALTELGVPPESQCLAALGPKMLDLSRERTAGAHPYLVTPEHTLAARAILGPGKLLAPEQGVILESDPAKARAIAAEALTIYLRLPNYRNNWLRLGFTEDDIAQVSPRLLDGLFAWGGIERVAERIKAHHDAGADHVCLQVVAPQGTRLTSQRAAWRSLAEALL